MQELLNCARVAKIDDIAITNATHEDVIGRIQACGRLRGLGLRSVSKREEKAGERNEMAAYDSAGAMHA